MHQPSVWSMQPQDDPSWPLRLVEQPKEKARGMVLRLVQARLYHGFDSDLDAARGLLPTYSMMYMSVYIYMWYILYIDIIYIHTHTQHMFLERVYTTHAGIHQFHQSIDLSKSYRPSSVRMVHEIVSWMDGWTFVQLGWKCRLGLSEKINSTKRWSFEAWANGRWTVGQSRRIWRNKLMQLCLCMITSMTSRIYIFLYVLY